MTIHKHYMLYCTSCNREYQGEVFESVEDVNTYYPNDWEKKRVENGSIWDFCPKCVEYYETHELE